MKDMVKGMKTQQLENVKRLDPKEIRKIRHKWETVLFGFNVILSIIVIILIVAMLALVPFLSDEFSSDEFWTIMTYPLLVPGLILTFICALYYMYAKTRAYALLVSDKNFPEIYKKSREFAEMLGMKKVPAVYIKQEHGKLNAFASALIGRRYIQLNAEIVDMAYMEHKDFSSIYFILAHEFGHHYYRHTALLRKLFTLIGALIPVFGPLLSRAQEYSADRVAQLLTESNGVEEMLPLVVGTHLYKYVDTEDYLNFTTKQKGFFIWLINLNENHPVVSKRMAALADPEKKSGKLL